MNFQRKETANIFLITTPSQMLNALEFIHFFNLRAQKNIVVITTARKLFTNQIIQIGINQPVEFNILINQNKFLLKDQFYTKMPMKLVYLIKAKINLQIIFEKYDVNKMILGNYSNFISQYATQIICTETYLLDDGNGSILIADKRKQEIQKNIPIFEFNQKKKALWVVKLIMGFYSYRIPKKFTFFSSYKFDVYGSDNLVINSYAYLSPLYSKSFFDNDLMFFIGSPLSEGGYVELNVEIDLIHQVLNMHNGKKIVYIPHRLDSDKKINLIKEKVEVRIFDLPIEYGISMMDKLPGNVVSFFSSALANLADIAGDRMVIYSFHIPEELYLTNNNKKRAKKIYSVYENSKNIKLVQL